MFRFATNRQGLLTLAISGSQQKRTCVVSPASSLLNATNSAGFALNNDTNRKPSGESDGIAAGADVFDFHVADERRVLWGPAEKPTNKNVFGITSVSATKQQLEEAYQLWLRLGHDPLLDAAVSPTLEGLDNLTAAELIWRKEDSVGANLLAPDLDEQHALESRRIWGGLVQDQYTTAIRYNASAQNGGAARNTVGTAQMNAGQDAADRPDSTWSQDSEFVRLSKLSQEYFGKPCSNREQVELAIRQADAESYAKFLNALGASDSLCLNLPATSGSAYEEEDLTEWATRYQSARLAANDTHVSLKAATSGGADTWNEVAATLGEIASKIVTVRAKRQLRQEAAKVVVPWNEADANAKLAQCYYHCELQYKSIAEAELDPEDSNDTSEEWLKENEEISALGATSIGVGSITFDTLWKHTTRVQALEFDHLLKDHESRLVAAQCRVRCIDEASAAAAGGDTSNVIQQVNSDDFAESFRQCQWDSSSNVLIPGMTDTWVKLNWFIFGSSNVFHHTSASHRKLSFNNSSLHTAFAAAQCFYLMRPLSQALDYSTPFVYRRSLTRVAKEFGVARQAQTQESSLHATNQLARAQRDVQVATDLALEEFGARRRAAVDNQFRKLNDGNPVAQIPNIRLAPADGGEAATTANTWAMGCTLQLQMEVPESIANSFAQLPEKSLTEVDNQTFGLEVVLLKRKQGGATSAAIAAEESKRRELVKSSSTLAGVHQQVTDRCAKLCPLPEGMTSDAAASGDDFEFVTVLCDNIAPDAEILRALEDHTTDKKLALWNFVLPRQTLSGAATSVPGAEYKLRVRLFDHARNPTHVPSYCQQGFSNAFAVEDTLLENEASFFGIDTSNATEDPSKLADLLAKIPDRFPGEQAIAYFSHLREKGHSVPLNLEFQAGQLLSPKGEVLRGRVHELLTKDSSSSVEAALGFTTPQLEIESHVRRHWNLLHPGLSDEEWYTRRRWVLAQALEEDFDWWHGVANEVTSDIFLNPSTNITKVEKRARALRDKVQVLQATGTSNRVSSLATTEAPVAHCRVRGDGSVDSFDIDPAVVSEEKVNSVSSVVSLCKKALQDGHLRMNSLAAVKIGDVEKALTANQLAEGGKESATNGKFGRTYLFAYDKVLSELGGSGITSQLEAELAEFERFKETDRMPSKEDASLRRKNFGFNLTAQKAFAEAVPPEHKTEWKS